MAQSRGMQQHPDTAATNPPFPPTALSRTRGRKGLRPLPSPTSMGQHSSCPPNQTTPIQAPGAKGSNSLGSSQANQWEAPGNAVQWDGEQGGAEATPLLPHSHSNVLSPHPLHATSPPASLGAISRTSSGSHIHCTARTSSWAHQHCGSAPGCRCSSSSCTCRTGRGR